MHVIRQFETHRAKTAFLARRPLRGRNLKQTLTIKIDRREWCGFVPRRLREGRERTYRYVTDPETFCAAQRCAVMCAQEKEREVQDIYV